MDYANASLLKLRYKKGIFIKDNNSYVLSFSRPKN